MLVSGLIHQCDQQPTKNFTVPKRMTLSAVVQTRRKHPSPISFTQVRTHLATTLVKEGYQYKLRGPRLSGPPTRPPTCLLYLDLNQKQLPTSELTILSLFRPPHNQCTHNPMPVTARQVDCVSQAELGKAQWA